MKWEDYEPKPMIDGIRRATDVKCPVCGNHLYKRIDLVLTSYPPSYIYECECGWTGIKH